MNPERLLQNFDRLIDTPDAVPRLRRFILDLAVRGKLVEQNPDDEPAAELLKIGSESVEVPFELPNKWVSARAGKLLNIQYGKARPAKDRSDRGRVPVYGSNGIVGYCEEALSEEAAIIIGRKGSAGAVNLCDGPSWTTDVAYFLIPPAFFNIRFLLTVLETLDLGSLGKGVKPGLSRSEAYQLPIMVPPLAEQHRIVAKVDELMKLCNELETAQAKREKRRDRLVAATLHGLNNGRNGDSFSFEDSAYFYFNHLPRLTTSPEHIQHLRQTILNLAVRGKLVLQDPKDEPAAELLKRIEAEKKRLFKAGKNRKEKLPSLNDLETPLFDLPESWKWTSIRQITSDRGQKVPSKNFSYIDVSAIDKEHGKIGQPQILTPNAAPTRARKIVQKGDVIYSCVRPYLLNVAVVEEEFKPEPIVSTAFAVLNGLGLVLPRYLWIVLRSPYFVACVEEKMRGQAYPAINDGDFAPLLVPLPPLAEQIRIVARVDELMALCDELETRINIDTTTSQQLLEATLQEAISGQSSLKQGALS